MVHQILFLAISDLNLSYSAVEKNILEGTVVFFLMKLKNLFFSLISFLSMAGAVVSINGVGIAG